MTTKRIPIYLLVIPALWAFSQVLVSLNIFRPEQLILYFSVLVSLIWLFSIKKYDQVKRAPLD
jgi:hypothetical protein